MTSTDDSSTVAVTISDDWYVARDGQTGVTSQGRTRPEALWNLSEALALFEEPIPDDIEAAVPDAPWFGSSGRRG